MRHTAMLAAMFAVLALVFATANADTTPMFGNIQGMVLQNGKPVAEARVEFVITMASGKAVHMATRTDDHGAYRIARSPYGRGYGKVSTVDSRGPATESVLVDSPNTVVNFKL